MPQQQTFRQKCLLYPGEHEAIIDEARRDEVQRRLGANRIDRASGAQPRSRAFWRG